MLVNSKYRSLQKGIFFRCLLCFVLSFSINFSFAQIDSIPSIDSTLVVSDSLSLNEKKGKNKSATDKEKNGLIKKIRDKTYPNPTRAAFLSLALPGTGQFYNKKYWKIPIIYAGIGVLTFVAIDQQKEYNYYKTQYKYRVDGDDLTIDDFPFANADAIRRIRNSLDKRRQQAYVGIAAFWLLNAVDAFVDAHLFSFDVDEDLTLQIAPNTIFNPYSNQNNLGIHFSLQAKSKSQEIPIVF